MNECPCSLNFLYDNLEEEAEYYTNRRKQSNSFQVVRSRKSTSAYEVIASPTGGRTSFPEPALTKKNND